MHFLWWRLQCPVGFGLGNFLSGVCQSGVRCKFRVSFRLPTYVKWLAVQPLHVHLRSCSLQSTWFVTDECVRQGQGHLAVVRDLTRPRPQHTTSRHLHGCTDLPNELSSHALHSACDPSRSKFKRTRSRLGLPPNSNTAPAASPTNAPKTAP